MSSLTEHCAPQTNNALRYAWTRWLLAFVPQFAGRRDQKLQLDLLTPHLLRDLGLAEPACRDDPWLR